MRSGYPTVPEASAVGNSPDEFRPGTLGNSPPTPEHTGTLTVMLDCAPLLAAADVLAGRFRSLPDSRLRGSLAQTGLELARWLAAEAQRIESPGEPVRLMPDEGIHVVGDQIAVAAHDLAAALRERPDLAPCLAAAVTRVEQAAKRCGR
jgi:hypothetical protein